jgi:DNA modification methylase
MELNKIIQGDSLEVLKTLPDESVDCVITSPPYWALRDYGVAGQLGLEPTFQEYITKLCDMFDEVKRVLKKEGTCWVNIGDTYMGNSSYSEKGRQGFGNDKIGMINKKQWTDPKHKNTKGRLRAREHTESGQII